MRAVFATLFAVAALAGPALAHHGWSEYDAEKVLNLTGTVERSTYANPHGELMLKTPDKVWRVVLAPVSRMQTRGLAAEDIKPGATVTVVGYPKKSDPSEMRAERIMFAGKTAELR